MVYYFSIIFVFLVWEIWGSLSVRKKSEVIRNNKETKLILPILPKNLETLYKEEEEIKTKSILEINTKPQLKDSLDIIYDSLNLIYDLTTSYRNPNNDELIIQYIGIRLFNDAVTSFKLMLAGYYQISFNIQRDILEVGFLLDYFTLYPNKIQHWKQCTDSQRRKFYAPSKVRKALDKRDDFTQKKRENIYKDMCKYASHVSYPGIKLVAPNGLAKIGPFYNDKYLKSCIQELAMRVPYFTLIYSGLFNNLPPKFLKIKVAFLSSLNTWSHKYFNIKLENIDVNELKS